MKDFILVVDDEVAVRELLVSQLAFLGFEARQTADGEYSLEIARSDHPPALVLLDIEMPGLSGVDLLRRLKKISEDIQVVMVSGLRDLGTVRECLREGAYDYLAKPFELEDLHNTAERAIERRQLIRQNRDYKEHLERKVLEKTEEIRRTRDLALMTLAKLAESRDSETGLHLERIAEYSRILARALRQGERHPEVDDEFVDWVVKSAPLHDIGKVGIADAILRKAGPLTVEESETMRRHTTIGGDTLRSVLEQFSGTSFLTMAMEIAYYHHERWDGGGYPFGLVGEEIPLAARIVSIADAYDAITSRRPYKEPLSHEVAVERIRVDSGKHFDPRLVEAFLGSEGEFAVVHRRLQGDQRHAAEPASAAAAPARGSHA
ncbi:MAG TPA: HD domain-containing phosphohydrolase [Thermoanaerobaculia bacterium]|jgi:putative two-component system response regulator